MWGKGFERVVEFLHLNRYPPPERDQAARLHAPGSLTHTPGPPQHVFQSRGQRDARATVNLTEDSPALASPPPPVQVRLDVGDPECLSLRRIVSITLSRIFGTLRRVCRKHQEQGVPEKGGLKIRPAATVAYVVLYFAPRDAEEDRIS
jgi:hypothetical protein